MDQKLLTEGAWKTIAAKFKVKDNGLQRALATYQKLDDKDDTGRLKAVALISQLAANLKKVKEVSAQEDLADYIASVDAAAELEKTEINKAVAIAAKAAVEAKKKADSQSNKQLKEQEAADDEEEERGEYHARLLTAFQKLKSAKGLAYEFIVCDAKPCGVMVAKKITVKHKAELTQVTGSKRFLHLGACHFENGKFVFTMEKPVTGLARKLQESIKFFTGKKLPILVGTETAESDDEQPSSAQPAKPAPAAEPVSPALAKAPEVWHQTRRTLSANLDQLKKAIGAQYAAEGPKIIAGIEQSLKKLDGILDKLDTRLGDSLAKAEAAKDAAARAAELNRSRDILKEYLRYVASEPIITHIDANPFGVRTNLRETLTTTLTQLARATG
jgi:hypothetical protein